MKRYLSPSPSLAVIAYTLRFFNSSDEEDAIFLPLAAPWGYQNIPWPVRVESFQRPKIGRSANGETYIETVEHFADGSSFAHSGPVSRNDLTPNPSQHER